MKVDFKGYYLLFVFISLLLCVFSLKLVVYGQGIFESAFIFIVPLFLEMLELFLNPLDDNGYHYKRDFEEKIGLILIKMNWFLLVASFIETAVLFALYEMKCPIIHLLRLIIILFLWIYPLKYFVEFLVNIYILYRKRLEKAKKRG